MKSIINFLSGFFWGFTLGGAVVLLTTPQSGPEFKEKTSDWVGQTATEWRKIRDERRAELEAQFVNLTQGL